MPKVSIGIPTYNSQKFLSQAIDSVLSQTFQDFELIISDDASTDKTPEIVANYAAKDKRIRYFRNPTRVGVFANFNKCIELSSGEYINILGHDDVMFPKNIEAKVNILDSYPSVGLVASSVEVIDDDNNCHQFNWSSAKYSEDVLEPAREWVIDKVIPNNEICCPFVFIRRQIVEKVGLFNCRYSYVGDFDLWLRIGLVADVYFLQEVLGAYRWHQSNQSHKYDDLYYLAEVGQVWDDIINKLDLADSERRNLEDRVVSGLFDYFVSQNRLNLECTIQICQFLDGWRGRNRDLTLAASNLGGYIQKLKMELDWSQSQLQETQTELARSQNTIAAMESSKFWKVRSLWFQARNVFGLAKNLSFQPSYLSSKIKILFTLWRERGTRGFFRFLYQRSISKLKIINTYQEWLAKNKLNKQDIASAHKQITRWQLHPKFSVLMPVYNVDAKWLHKAIESVRNQIYSDWELCIADDASTETHVRSVLTQYSKLDPRIKVVFRSQNGNISAASNSALELATGDYIALLDHDDELAIDALFENAKLINSHPDADFIYSDEDKLDTKGNRLDPFFKPDWSPDYFHGCMYTCHLGIYRTSLIREIGGFRSGYDGAQDYDLVLRVVEKTKNIYHIPKVLYHWRIIPASVTSGEQAKPWAYIAARKALEAMLERSPYPGHVEEGPRAGFFRVRRDIVGQPLVSIIIPSAGKMIESGQGSLCLLENCLRSIQQLSTYSNFEVIVVDGYDIPETTLEAIAAPNVHLVRCSEPFNFSMRINQGAAKAKGDFLLMLNDDTKVITPDWLESMLELAQQQEIGAVGAKLFYPNGKIQHAGVMVLDGNPGHAFHNCEGDHPGYFCSNIINRNYLAVTGACLMIRAETFHQLEGFDEEFPLNYNDVDFCLKACQAGYRNVVSPYVQLIHYESASRKEGLRPGEWEKLNNKWSKQFNGLKKDPYYNQNLSSRNCNFELA